MPGEGGVPGRFRLSLARCTIRVKAGRALSRESVVALVSRLLFRMVVLIRSNKLTRFDEPANCRMKG